MNVESRRGRDVRVWALCFEVAQFQSLQYMFIWLCPCHLAPYVWDYIVGHWCLERHLSSAWTLIWWVPAGVLLVSQTVTWPGSPVSSGFSRIGVDGVLWIRFCRAWGTYAKGGCTVSHAVNISFAGVPVDCIVAVGRWRGDWESWLCLFDLELWWWLTALSSWIFIWWVVCWVAVNVYSVEYDPVWHSCSNCLSGWIRWCVCLVKNDTIYSTVFRLNSLLVCLIQWRMTLFDTL